MEQARSNKHASASVLTIPNLLSFLRLLMIPAIVWMELSGRNALLTAGLVIISGLTDLADGYIARRFHMVSDLGKALDPIADKLTQAAVLACLALRYPLMILPLALLMLKETAAAIIGLLVIRRTGHVYSADWHGKVATALLYAMMTLHLLWSGIPPAVSTFFILLCTAVLCFSCVCYTGKNLHRLQKGRTD